jgi:dipeptidyl aminopeptidase/acylaminoacyl peptidase
MNHQLIPALVAALFLYGTGCAAAQPAAVIAAYTQNGYVNLVDSKGHLIKSIATNPHAGNFALSKDVKRIVYTPRDAAAIGGALYLLDVSTGKIERLSKGPYAKGSSPPREVYSDPSFSPDDKSVVFAIHSAPTGDALAMSGPIAIMALATRKVNLLSATTNFGGNGPGFSNYPTWSPSGEQVLLNFEASAAVIQARGDELNDLSTFSTDLAVQRGVGWIGPSCVVYIAGTNWKDASERTAVVVNLRTKARASLDRVTGTSPDRATGVVSVAWPRWVRNDGVRLVIEDTRGTDQVALPLAGTFVQVVADPLNVNSLPALCR